MTSYWDEIAADSPVLVLRMDEASGNLLDSSGYGHDATPSGGALTYEAAGPDAVGIPKAVSFGSTSLATILDHADLDLGDGPWAIEAWLKRPTAGAQGVVLTKYASGSDGYEVWVTSGNLWRSAQGDGSSFAGTPAYTDTGWHHWVFTCSSGAAGTGTIYRDGSDLSIGPNSRTFIDNNANLVIGAAAGGMIGSYAALAIYKSVLSGARWTAHYDARSNPEIALQQLYPDADVADGGWTTTPLWSKVDEVSAGGDVITATAS